jgi:hypothetical protein
LIRLPSERDVCKKFGSTCFDPDRFEYVLTIGSRPTRTRRAAQPSRSPGSLRRENAAARPSVVYPISGNEKALQLDPHERALLAEHLIGSLDADEEPEVERLWVEEAERRYKEHKEGTVKSKPAALVIREARAKFK